MSTTNLKLITGPLYIGSIFNWALFGCMSIQLYDYYTVFNKKDRPIIRYMVYTLFCVELFQTFLITHTSFRTLVLGWGDPAELAAAPWSSAAIPCVNAIVSCVVQCFFAWRIYTLKQNLFVRGIACLIGCVALMQCAAGTAVTVEFTQLALNPAKLGSVDQAAEVWLVGSLVADVLIASTMVTILMQARRGSAFKTTENLVNRLIINTIETGLITACVASVELFFFLKYPTNFIHVTEEFILGRLYTNVLLATLNGRSRSTYQHMTQDYSTNHLITTSNSGSNPMRLDNFTGATSDTRHRSGAGTGKGVSITTETIMDDQGRDMKINYQV